DIPTRLRPNRPDRTEIAVCTGDVDQPMTEDRCGNGNVAAAVQAPKVRAGRQVVTRCFVPSINNDFLPAPILHHVRCAPGRDVLPRRAPQFLSILNVERGQEWLSQHVAKDQYLAVTDYWRA